MEQPEAGRYRHLPPLAGLSELHDAMRPGLSVEQCVSRLKRFHYAFKRLHGIFVARLTSEPLYELKTGFAHHAYLCAEHVTALRQRIGEMREPPLGLEVVPDVMLQILFDEILAAPTTEALLLGIYEIVLKKLDLALEFHLRDTNPLTDAPSVRLIRFARLEIDDLLVFGTKAIECLVSDAQYQEHRGWLDDLDQMAGAISGAIDGDARA